MSNIGDDEVTIKKRKICIPCGDEGDDTPKKQRLGDDATTLTGAVVAPPPSVPRSILDAAMANTLVDRREFRRVGPYILGPKIGCSPVDSIVQYLAKREGSNEFVQLKVSNKKQEFGF